MVLRLTRDNVKGSVLSNFIADKDVMLHVIGGAFHLESFYELYYYHIL